MADNKKSFVAYCDWLESFEELSDEEAGKLAKHLFRHVNDLNPEAPDKLTKMCFIPIKQSLKRDLIKYENKAKTNRLNGKKGGRPKNPNKPNGYSGLKEEPKKADSDSVSVNVSDNVNDNEIKIYRKFSHLDLSVDEFNKLNEVYDKKDIDFILDSIENFKGNDKYKSLYLTSLNWLKRDKGIKSKQEKENYRRPAL